MNPLGFILLGICAIMELIVWLIIRPPLRFGSQFKVSTARFILCGLGLLILEAGFVVALVIALLYSGIVSGIYESKAMQYYK